MQGIKRRLVYVSLYEFIAIIASALLLLLISNADGSDSFGLAVAASATAILWNLVFNYGFEHWERHTKRIGRTLGIRVVHALGFEGGLAIFLVPMIAWWLDVSFMEALILDLGLLTFFLIYTFIFNWAFDVIFGLPASVMPATTVSS